MRALALLKRVIRMGPFASMLFLWCSVYGAVCPREVAVLLIFNLACLFGLLKCCEWD